MGCRGPGCSQCRGHLRTQGGSCTPEHLGGQETVLALQESPIFLLLCVLTHRPVAGGPALGAHAAGRGHAGVGGRPLLLAQHADGRQPAVVVDDARRLGRGPAGRQPDGAAWAHRVWS